MRVLNGLTDLDEQFETLTAGELVLSAVVGDLAAARQFHHEIGPARVSRTRIENFSDVGMVHHRQRLPFSVEANG